MTMETFMDARPHLRSEASCIGLAVAGALERRHPVHTAKMIARALSAQGPECTIRTAENILQGHLSARTLTRLVEAYGLGLLIEAGASVTGQSLEDYIIENAEKARRERVAARARWKGCRDQLRALRESNHSTTSSADREVARIR